MTWQTITEMILQNYRQKQGFTSSLCVGLCREVERKQLVGQITAAVNIKLTHLQFTDALIESCRDYGLKVDLQ